jgi:hypothetical protein
VDGWDDDSDILGGVGWIGRYGDGLVAPMANSVDNEANISMKPVVLGQYGVGL